MDLNRIYGNLILNCQIFHKNLTVHLYYFFLAKIQTNIFNLKFLHHFSLRFEYNFINFFLRTQKIFHYVN